MTDALQPTPTSGVETGPVVSVREFDLQPWFALGAAFVTWTDGDVGDSRGVLDRDTGSLGFGVRGRPTDDGWQRTLDLPPAALAELTAAIDEWRHEFPGSILGSEVPATGDRTQPAASPVDAAATSGVAPVRLPEWGDNGKTAYVQAWRPRNAGSVYVATRIGEFVDQFGTFTGETAYFHALPPELHLGIADPDGRVANAVDSLR